jgi:tetratricopeptide (TPR) repeat protein
MKKILIVFKIVLSLVFTTYIIYASFMSLTSKDKNERFKKASQHQGSIKSQNLFKELIKDNPDFSDAYFEYSVAFNKRGDFANGFEFLNKAVQLEPNIHLGYRGWLRLRKLRDYNNALKDFEEYDSQTPKTTDYPWGENLNFLKGECYFGKNEFEKAIEEFRKVIDKDKDYADIHNYVYLGLCYYKLNQKEAAILQFNKLLSIYDTTCEADYYLAKIYFEKSEFEKARIHIINAEKNIAYKREDSYNEFLNEVYLTEIIELKNKISNRF